MRNRFEYSSSYGRLTVSHRQGNVGKKLKTANNQNTNHGPRAFTQDSELEPPTIITTTEKTDETGSQSGPPAS